MVEDLINADADINAADNSGKTALHWAAAVNNVDAVNVLLMHGANRDAQDDKVRDPRIDKGVKVALIFSLFFSCINFIPWYCVFSKWNLNPEINKKIQYLSIAFVLIQCV